MTPFTAPAIRTVAHPPFPTLDEPLFNKGNGPFSGIELSVAAAAAVLWLALSFS